MRPTQQTAPECPVNAKYTAEILHSRRTPRPRRELFVWMMLLARGAPDTRLARSRVHFRHYQSNRSRAHPTHPPP